MAFERAVVIGASVAGLLASAALAERFGRVTIVERDELPTEPEPRRGVPQGAQVHALLAIGIRSMNELVPGFVDDLVAAGAEPIDQGNDIPIYNPTGWIARGKSEAQVVAVRRPVLEHVLRSRVTALPNVEIIAGTATGLLATDDKRRVTGVALKRSATDELFADLVVDASGRASRSTRWVEDLGYPQVGERQLNIGIGYATAVVNLPEDALPDGVRGILGPPSPALPRGCAVMACGSGQYQLAALSMGGEEIPTEREAYLRYLESGPTPLVGQIARKAEFVTEPVNYKLAGTRRFLWEDLPRRPEAFIAVGDAVMGFNPIYGQGMSVAAAEALRLRRHLAGATSIDGLAEKVQTSFREVIDIVFGSVFPIDAAYPTAELVGLDPVDPAVLQAGQVLAEAATDDLEVANAMRAVTHLFTQEPLADPAIQEKIQAWAAEGRTVRNNDPAVIPAPLG
ncbi:NAD(P)/FAD-dependent oxidoreductase [Amycolatopsis thermoflava]|uniref:NAD(P)/FAD-dependent oxidoreductase n=1 Tax=Amycolatopsis thermoflava TaxID=84480 RepID=UPI003824DC8F